MEFASYLAGERWSDHPACTDPTLAALARHVNDTVSDDARAELVPDIPRVVGLADGGRVIGIVTALRAASIALPVSAMERQHALAMAVLGLLPAAEREGAPTGTIEAARAALATVPAAERWARERMAEWRVDEARLIRRGLQPIVHLAALGVAEACIFDSDQRLVRMLRDAIADAEALRTAPVEEPIRQYA